MSEFGPIEALTLRAAADLRTSKWRIMRIVAAGTTNVASNGFAASQVGPVGVLQNKPNSGQAATIGVGGESKVVAGAAVTLGDWVTTNGCGQCIVAASGHMVIGRALVAAAAANEVIRVLIHPPFRLGAAV